MKRALAIVGVVVATATLLAAPTASFSAESKKPKEIVVVGSKAKAGQKGLKASGSPKRGDGPVRTFNLMNTFPQK